MRARTSLWEPWVGNRPGPPGTRTSNSFTRPSYPREEPYEVVPHVRICAGGGPKGPFLPRSTLLAQIK